MNKPWISNKMIDKIFSEHKIISELEVEESSPLEIGMEENLFTESEVEESSSSEIGMEENLFTESEVEESSPSEIGMEESSPPELKEGRLAGLMTIKIPFHTISEVADFLISPIVSSTNEEVFAFQNEENEIFRELDTKLLATVHHYNEQPYCRLISSKLFEKRIFLEFSSENYIKHSGENQLEQSLWVPIHNLNLKQRNEKKRSNYVTTKLPVEIGKYKTEISLEERVMFQEEVEIKEVLQEIVLTDSKFFPQKVLKSKENSVTIEKGKLLVEGYVVQRIEYTMGCSNEQSDGLVRYQLLQKIVLELIVQILQEQEVQVEIM
ncbi:BC_2427 family protein [Bacillus pseudomycoides]|uniref:BC_2427 family protein n=1 Tax=Bacillus pseudomycoides TaxID=64104 RepID=UPI000BEB3B59|nr:hypothetical protein [Bacillus pseudomycoides]PEB43037.1 hypothetical protein COO06_03815 [Bacillus pseudomycoides]PGD90093.1 hypothetical protein COM50_26815 [Bacillus pseudomycoides]PGD92750.1 hypothetical protein COM49_28495 [Bacillus pseudomycoides]PHE61344.1 hypothetical protein COF69_28595 [Bacillus pseudomycoides]PHG14568.1 hypothetical protein COI47_27945 [Bacillus pseudomycoides]